MPLQTWSGAAFRAVAGALVSSDGAPRGPVGSWSPVETGSEEGTTDSVERSARSIVFARASGFGSEAGSVCGILKAAALSVKNGVSARASSPGVWNLRPGSLAIIRDTTAANSTGISGETKLRGLASTVL
jgi:hypothetical protein